MALVGAQFVNAVSPNPVGSLQAFAGASAPTGWLLCDGTSYSTSVYPELFSVLGYTYGGSGANFNVPDMRGRVPMGAGTGAGLNSSGTGAPSGTAMTVRTRGQWGGEETHLLTSAESGMPAHNHNITIKYFDGSGGHNHGSSGGTVAQGSSTPIANNGTATDTTAVQSQAAQNASSRHSVIPPFIVTNYIIKAIPDAPRSGLAYGSTPPVVTALPSNPQFGEVVSFSINNGTQLVPCQWTGSRWCALVGGGPIQVVQVVKTDAMAAAPNALWGDIPGLAATITPIFNTSKVLVTVDLKGAGAQSSSVMSVRLLRDSTPVFIGDAASNRRRAMSQEYNGNISGDSNFAMAQMGGTFLDSPATTSAITYKVQFGGDSSGSVLYVNRTQGDRDNANMDARGASSITLMEMAA